MPFAASILLGGFPRKLKWWPGPGSSATGEALPPGRATRRLRRAHGGDCAMELTPFGVVPNRRIDREWIPHTVPPSPSPVSNDQVRLLR